MNAADWIAVASAVGAVGAAVAAAFAIFYNRKDTHKSAEAAEKFHEETERQVKISERSAEAAEKSQKETERQVKISERIADVADQTFGSSSQPIIVSDAIPDPPFTYLHEAADKRNTWSKTDFAVFIHYPIRNVGVGPAMIMSVKMTIITGESDKTSTIYDASSSVAVIAPTEVGLINLRATHMDKAFLIRSLESAETLTVEISYTGIGAKRRYLTRFALKPRTHMALKSFPGTTDFTDFRLETTQIYECDELGNIKEPPIASNKPPGPDGPPQD
jgi:hypothetical protein